jgi:hypothetical protein
MTVFRNAYVLPRAVFFDNYGYLPVNVHDWRNRNQALSALAGPLGKGGIDPSKTLLIHDKTSHTPAPSATPVPGSPTVNITQYLPNRVRIAVETPRPGLVFMSDNLFPGWQAFRDGRRTEILRSWLTFRSVEVPAGKSTIEFVYQPFILRFSIFVSVICALGWIFVYIRYHIRRPSLGEISIHVPAAKKKTRLATAPPEPDGLAECAAIAERIVTILVGAIAISWISWSAFVYGGGIQNNLLPRGDGLGINTVACILGLGVVAFAAREIKNKSEGGGE